jgi:endonuclease YncB( thermonuclease family)
MAISFLGFMGYGFVTDYLGYEFTGINTSDAEVPTDAAEHRVKRIVDGDTVHMKDGTKVRLHGIDTPERDQPYGKQATRNLDKLIGRTVFVVEKDTDRYGRLVGTLYTPRV